MEPALSWVKVGAKCTWLSRSLQKTVGVTITQVDLSKKLVKIHFDADANAWKVVPFREIGGDGLLQPRAARPTMSSGRGLGKNFRGDPLTLVPT